jgi:hypothetical protein
MRCSKAFTVALLFLLTAAQGIRAQTASSWPEADKLFHGDPRWLGADAAFSIDLGKGRVCWLFGDTWIAQKGAASRRHAWFVRDTVGIENGYDPAHATMRFFWAAKGDGTPTEIFPSEGDTWMWPGSGIRVGSALVVFAGRFSPDRSKNSLGFKSAGWNAYLISDPDSDPSTWKPEKVAEVHDTVVMASAVVRQGSYAYLFGESEPQHDLYVARTSVDSLAKGRFDSLAWWTGREWSDDKAARRPIIHDAATESSVQPDPTGNGFIEVNSQGFGASEIVLRRAPKLTGPWSPAQMVYRPPESDEPDPFVYAAKSHVELRGADLILTYATNGFTDAVNDNMARYFPRFVRVELPPHR